MISASSAGCRWSLRIVRFTLLSASSTRDGKIILESDRAKFYATQKGDPLPDLNDELTIHHPENLDESVLH